MLSVNGQKSFVYFYMSQDTRLIIFLEQGQQLFTGFSGFVLDETSLNTLKQVLSFKKNQKIEKDYVRII